MNDVIRGSDLKRTPHLPHDEGGPVFAAPWEAKAFGMAVDLHRHGVFDWGEWCDALGAEIAAAQEAGDPDLGDTYYHHWLSALEGLVARKAVTDMETLRAVREDWRAADHRRAFGEAPVLVRSAGEHDHG